jgi:hypothetical protein
MTGDSARVRSRRGCTTASSGREDATAGKLLTQSERHVYWHAVRDEQMSVSRFALSSAMVHVRFWEWAASLRLKTGLQRSAVRPCATRASAAAWRAATGLKVIGRIEAGRQPDGLARAGRR